MFPHHSVQMSQRSQDSQVTLWCPTKGQGQLLSCSGLWTAAQNINILFARGSHLPCDSMFWFLFVQKNLWCERRNKKGGNIHYVGWKKMWNVYLLPTMRADYCRQLNQCVWLNVVSWPPTGLIYFQALTVIPWFIQCWQTKVNKLSNNHSRNDQQPWQGGRLTVNPWCNSNG